LHQLSSILIVEDQHILRELLIEILVDAGFLVAGCDSAEAAQEMLAEEPYDAIIADNTLAGDLTGMDLLRWAANRYPALGLVLLSGNPHSRTNLPARTVFLSKPCTIIQLTDALSQAKK